MPKRPTGVPPDAVWNAADREWEQGQTKNGVSIGTWRWWRPQGTLACESRFDVRGELHGLYQRFHSSGRVSQEGEFHHGEPVNIRTYYRSEKRTTERFPFQVGDRVAKLELDFAAYSPRARYAHMFEHDPRNFRFFDIDGVETNREGAPIHSKRSAKTPRETGANKKRTTISFNPAIWGVKNLPSNLRITVVRRIRAAELKNLEKSTGELPDTFRRWLVEAGVLGIGHIDESKHTYEFLAPAAILRTRAKLRNSIGEETATYIQKRTNLDIRAMVPIVGAGSGNFFLLGNQRHNDDAIFAWYHDEPMMISRISPSFSKFLATLVSRWRKGDPIDL